MTLLEVLAFQARATLCCTGAVPVPVSDCVAVGFEALLIKPKFAEAVPDACGAKVTVNVAELPAAIVSGREMPLSVNSELVMLADDTVTDPVLAVSVPV